MEAHTNKRQVPILMYHSISYDAAAKFRQFTVSPPLFAEQMAYLYQQAYTPLTVTQFVTMCAMRKAELPAKPVVITFDDGFADFYHEALPILQRYEFPASLYITTAFINGTSAWLKREGETKRQMLTGQQLREISALGIECGAHSHQHRQLDILPLSESRDEIVRSKELLEQHLGQRVSSFAYPFGYYTAALQQMVREAGYTSACAVKHMLSSLFANPFALSRLMVSVDTDRASFATLVDGRGSTTMATLYMRARTPIWQVVRRSSALMKRSIQESVRA